MIVLTCKHPQFASLDGILDRRFVAESYIA